MSVSPYIPTKSIAGNVMGKPENLTGNFAYATRFSVVAEGLGMVTLRTCAASGSISLDKH
jgi:hypothetical protein